MPKPQFYLRKARKWDGSDGKLTYIVRQVTSPAVVGYIDDEDLIVFEADCFSLEELKQIVEVIEKGL